MDDWWTLSAMKRGQPAATSFNIIINSTLCWVHSYQYEYSTQHYKMFVNKTFFSSFCCFIQKQFKICIQNGENHEKPEQHFFLSQATVKLARNGIMQVRKDAVFSLNPTKQIKLNDIQHGEPKAVLVRDKRCSRAMLGTAQRERAQHGWALCYSERDRRSDRVERDKGQEGALHVADSSGVRRLCCLSITDPRDAPAASSRFPRHRWLLSCHCHLSHVSKFPLLF